MRSKRFVCVAILVLIFVGLAYVSWTDYEDLDCEERFNLEVWYAEHYPDDEMVNATFTRKQIATLSLSEACDE